MTNLALQLPGPGKTEEGKAGRVLGLSGGRRHHPVLIAGDEEPPACTTGSSPVVFQAAGSREDVGQGVIRRTNFNRSF
jgi:hypothetical protein|nr:MAG: Hypothetical protein CGL2_11278041 [Leptospirillum sp. Group II '5-way CG']